MRQPLPLTAAVLLFTLLALPVLAVSAPMSYGDTFATGDYNGNAGTTDFIGPWTEVSESDGPDRGYVFVLKSDACAESGCLVLGGMDPKASNRGIYRAADLSNMTHARLSVRYGRHMPEDSSHGRAVIQISPNLGSSWKTLKSIDLNTDDGGMPHVLTYDITKWATANTLIRFKITNAISLQAYLLIDDVSIDATSTFPPITTTTSKPTVTTTAGPRDTTTTSSVPPTTTTTVHDRATTTTTRPMTVISPDVSAEDRDMMMEKRDMAVTTAMPPMALPGNATGDLSEPVSHAQPVEALGTAFFTEAGDYGGNLVPSIVLGIVIAVVSLIGLGSHSSDESDLAD